MRLPIALSRCLLEVQYTARIRGRVDGVRYSVNVVRPLMLSFFIHYNMLTMLKLLEKRHGDSDTCCKLR